MPIPDSETDPEPEDEDVDPFAELGVDTSAAVGNIGDGLDAFMDGDDEEEPVDSDPVVVQHDDEEEDDDDMFATLGVAGPSVALASSGEDDILSAFMEDDDEEEPEETTSALSTEAPAPPQNDAIDAYKMVLETVWVDGILDPGEVNLLAKRREELNISFEEHLNLVRELLG